ncbi:MAG TPA: hypothetical protein VHZ03_30570 [Trebonia sp.]|nr:hypothetical protein [Trebonia sp.]
MSGPHEDAVRVALTERRRAGAAHQEAARRLDAAVIAALRAGKPNADIAEWSNYDPRWIARLAEIYTDGDVNDDSAANLRYAPEGEAP